MSAYQNMEQNEYKSITHGVGIILKEKRPSVRGKDHFVDDTLGKCCVKINGLKDGERHEMWLLLELIVSTLITTQSEKDTTLAYYHRIHGNKWAEIAKHLPGSVFLLGGGSISWASKKQTCISGSTMKCEFVALAAVGKEAEWLRNLIHEILI
ncbi:zinc finger, CCHC-type containing protein [Tanacetum coccineum]